MLQKVLAASLILLLSSTGMVHSYTIKDQILTRADLWRYSDYAPVLETAMPQMSNEKLLDLDAKIKWLVWTKSGDIWVFIDYVAMLVDIEILNRGEIEKNIPYIAQEVFPTMYEDRKVLSQEDIQKVEKEIMSAQNNINSELSTFIDSTITSWDEMTHYEEKWNFKMLIEMVLEWSGDIEGWLNISDYVSQTQLFDQHFEGEVDSFLQANIFGEELDVSLWSNIELIVKDGKYYLKMDNITSKNSSKNVELPIDIYIETLEALAKENTYLSLSSPETEAGLEILQNINPQSMQAQIDLAFSFPLLEAYEKNDSTYLLRPTKHFCDIGKNIANVFDPFGGRNCTQWQYEDMLEDFMESGIDMILSLGNENTLSISHNSNDENINIDISWKSNELTKIIGKIWDNWESMDFSYIPRDAFTLNINIDGIEADLLLNIDKNDKISSGTFEMSIEDNLTVDGVYQNNRLDIDITWGDDGTQFVCNVSGKLKWKYMDMMAWCDITSPDLSDILPVWRDTMRMESSLLYDSRANKNNMAFTLHLDINSTNYIKVDISNTGSRRNIAPGKIITPSKTKDIEEFLTEVYPQTYSDEYYDDYSYDDEDILED
jgi:hypothetical protein